MPCGAGAPRTCALLGLVCARCLRQGSREVPSPGQTPGGRTAAAATKEPLGWPLFT